MLRNNTERREWVENLDNYILRSETNVVKVYESLPLTSAETIIAIAVKKKSYITKEDRWTIESYYLCKDGMLEGYNTSVPNLVDHLRALPK